MTDFAASRPWRCFVAVPLPEALRNELREWVAGVRQGGTLDADWRWTDPEACHITLAFLGATPPEAVPGIGERLSFDLVGRSGFSVSTGGIGAFPGRSHARVLWYGVRDPDRQLTALARIVRDSTGTDEGTPFRPHVTLARARDRRGTPLPPLPVEALPAGDVPVGAVSLIRSHLGGGPARYEMLAQIPLLTTIGTGALA